jgi:hypothetical protein
MHRDLLHREIGRLARNSNQNRFATGNHPNLTDLEENDPLISEKEIKPPSRILKLIGNISSSIQNIKRKSLSSISSKREKEFLPTSVPGVGMDFDIVIDLMYDLENAAIKEGYNFDQRISAFRKVFYSSRGWDIIIPAAVSVKFPVSWETTLKSKRQQLAALETIPIHGNATAISHLFAGLDAINNKVQPLSLKYKDIIKVTQISSNGAQATYSGDLGSVVYEYQKARGNVSFRNMAMKRDLPLLQKIYTKYVSDADMAGNADAYSIVLNKSQSVVQNLFEYYTAPAKSGVHLRYLTFADALFKSASSTSVKTQLMDDVFSSSLAYAVGLKNDKNYVILILQKPRPGIVVPTFWEAAHNATGWVLEEFLDRLEKELDKIKNA